MGAASLIAMQTQVIKHQQEAQLVKEGKLDAEELRLRCGRRRLPSGCPECHQAARAPPGVSAPLLSPLPSLPSIHRRKGKVAALLERKNAGVAARDQRDRLEVKVAVVCCCLLLCDPSNLAPALLC